MGGVDDGVSAIQKYHHAGLCIQPSYSGVFFSCPVSFIFEAFLDNSSLSLQAQKADLPKRFLDRLQLHHAIVLPGTDRPLIGRGGIPLVLIDVEKRQGNR